MAHGCLLAYLAFVVVVHGVSFMSDLWKRDAKGALICAVGLAMPLALLITVA